MKLQHLGIIMDGNGRWAERKGWRRSRGHFEGLKAAKRITRAASEQGVRWLSLFVFSTENWKRSSGEVGGLMRLLKIFLERETAFYQELELRIVHSGDADGLPDEVRRALERVVALTAAYGGMTVNLAINYGGRDEIVRAVNRREKSGKAGAATESSLAGFFDVPEMPDLDLVIRTAGEKRLSNFLLWHAAYAEYYFSPRLWPDWTEEDLRAALADFAGRKRTFGALTVPYPEKILLN